MARIIGSPTNMLILYSDTSILSVSIAGKYYLTIQKVWITAPQWDASFFPLHPFFILTMAVFPLHTRTLRYMDLNTLYGQLAPLNTKKTFSLPNYGLKFLTPHLQNLNVENFGVSAQCLPGFSAKGQIRHDYVWIQLLHLLCCGCGGLSPP